jgi:hypothetical protein
MRRRIHVSYEEEDACDFLSNAYEEEDTCVI